MTKARTPPAKRAAERQRARGVGPARRCGAGEGSRDPSCDWRRGDYVISTDPERVQIDVVHAFLTTAYWCEGISRDLVERATRGSLSFGLYRGAHQVGFARVVTDRATFGYLLDVFVLPEHRGRGLARWLMTTILAHPELQGFRRWMLGTKDAHRLYEGVGFGPCAHPERVMEIVDLEVYRRGEPPR